MPNLNLLPFWKGDKGDGVQQIADASNPDAGPLDGAEYATVSRGAGVLKTTLTAIAQFARAPLSDANDVDKGAFMVGRGTVTVFSVAELLSARRATDLTYNVRGYYLGSTYGGGPFYYDATRAKSAHNGGTILSPTVPFNGTPAGLANFLDGVGETDPGGTGCFVRRHGEEVFVDDFGAVGDAARPTSGAPDGNVTGTDDTKAVGACRDYLQEIAFQPNLFVGFWGGYKLCFSANKCYYVKGHNPLGSTRPRNSEENPSGNLYRQSWRIDAKNALIVWEVTASTDALIESHEAFTTQEYHWMKVIVAKAVGRMGRFYSNIANPGRNATQRHRFIGCEVYHAMPSSTEHGLDYTFYYEGDNLGDRLITEQCAFSQAHTHFYSENGEAVQQSFKSTTFSSYLDNSIMFYPRRHGSSMAFDDGCGFLLKGNNATLFKTKYLPGFEGGSNGSNLYFSISGSRLECEGGKLQTIADLDFGTLQIDGITMAAGGLPDPASYMFITRKTGCVIATSSHLYGRLAVGAKDATNTTVRAYGIFLDKCKFSNDIASQMYVETAIGFVPSAGTYVNFKDALVANTSISQTPPIVIDGTANRTATFQGLTADTRLYAFDGVYGGTNDYFTNNLARATMIGRHRTSAGHWYCDNRDYIVLPPFTVITSIVLDHGATNLAVVDTVRFKVGSATLDYALTATGSGKRQIQLLAANQVIIISDTDLTQRTVSLECRLAGATVASPNQIGHVVITYRPAFGRNEITTTVDGSGIRLTRLTT